MLYAHPPDEISDFGIPVDSTLYRTVHQSISHVFDWDMEAYLLPETSILCQEFFRINNFDLATVRLETQEDRANPLVPVYLQLRTTLQTYIDQGTSPKLGLVPAPAGAYKWQPGEGFEADDMSNATLPLDEIETGIVQHSNYKMQ